MLGFFVLVIWFWLLIVIFSDIFRSQDMGGGAKMLWVLFVVILLFLGIFVYLTARGGTMHERAAAQAARQQESFDAAVKPAADGASSADDLAKLADLKTQGVPTDAEFEAQKARLLAQSDGAPDVCHCPRRDFTCATPWPEERRADLPLEHPPSAPPRSAPHIDPAQMRYCRRS
jgi:hypothetical protein